MTRGVVVTLVVLVGACTSGEQSDPPDTASTDAPATSMTGEVDEVKGLEVSQATQAATLAGAQATQAAAHAGTWSTMSAGAGGLIVGIFLGMAITRQAQDS